MKEPGSTSWGSAIFILLSSLLGEDWGTVLMSEGGRKEVLTGRGENCYKRKEGRESLAEREAGDGRV